MNKTLEDKIEQKIQETLSNKDEICNILEALSTIDSSKSFGLGIVIGRLYNSFYYQTRRILGRNPTDDEFKEFLSIIRAKRFETLW